MATLSRKEKNKKVYGSPLTAINIEAMLNDPRSPLSKEYNAALIEFARINYFKLRELIDNTIETKIAKAKEEEDMVNAYQFAKEQAKIRKEYDEQDRTEREKLIALQLQTEQQELVVNLTPIAAIFANLKVTEDSLLDLSERKSVYDDHIKVNLIDQLQKNAFEYVFDDGISIQFDFKPSEAILKPKNPLTELHRIPVLAKQIDWRKNQYYSDHGIKNPTAEDVLDATKFAARDMNLAARNLNLVLIQLIPHFKQKIESLDPDVKARLKSSLKTDSITNVARILLMRNINFTNILEQMNDENDRYLEEEYHKEKRNTHIVELREALGQLKDKDPNDAEFIESIKAKVDLLSATEIIAVLDPQESAASKLNDVANDQQMVDDQMQIDETPNSPTFRR